MRSTCSQGVLLRGRSAISERSIENSPSPAWPRRMRSLHSRACSASASGAPCASSSGTRSTGVLAPSARTRCARGPSCAFARAFLLALLLRRAAALRAIGAGFRRICRCAYPPACRCAAASRRSSIARYSRSTSQFEQRGLDVLFAGRARSPATDRDAPRTPAASASSDAPACELTMASAQMLNSLRSTSPISRCRSTKALRMAQRDVQHLMRHQADLLVSGSLLERGAVEHGVAVGHHRRRVRIRRQVPMLHPQRQPAGGGREFHHALDRPRAAMLIQRVGFRHARLPDAARSS